MATRARSPRDVLSSDEVRELTTPSDLLGAASVAGTWSIIVGCFAIVAVHPRWWTWVLAVVVLGGRQLALSVLMHEASHRSLFRTRTLNDSVGRWLCGAPMWQHLDKYRRHHMQHHNHTATERDPDLCLVEPFPTSTRSLLRKLGRDLFGLTGVRRVIGLLAMDAGVLEYTASSDVTPIDQSDRSHGDRLRDLARNLWPTLAANGVGFAILATLGHPEIYLLWIIAYLTTFSLFLRIRSIAEHACTERTTDPFRNTRTILSNPIARFFVAPHGVNYHLEHHLLMTVPHYRLRRMHRLLRERGALDQSPIAAGYAAVLREAAGRA